MSRVPLRIVRLDFNWRVHFTWKLTVLHASPIFFHEVAARFRPERLILFEEESDSLLRTLVAQFPCPLHLHGPVVLAGFATHDYLINSGEIDRQQRSEQRLSANEPNLGLGAPKVINSELGARVAAGSS